MKILITTNKNSEIFKTFFTNEAIKAIEGLGEIIYNPFDRALTKEELRDYLKDIDFVYTSWGVHRFDEYILEKASKLKVIAHTGGTIAPLQSEELAKRDIVVLSGNKLYAESVAEGTLCYILIAQRKLVNYINQTREFGWNKEYLYTKGLKNKVIGLIGFGMIAQNLARILQVFDVKIKIYSSYLTQEEADKYNAEVCSLEEIFSTCDIISVHSGLNKKNYHLIGKNYLDLMKDDALIVNTARGAVINENELAEELAKGRIRAALDVFETEPLPEDSKLRGLDNVLIIPHKGGPTTDVRAEVTIALAKDIRKFMDGEKNLEYQISLDYAKFMTDESKFK